jgi:hypothetical protein
LFRHTEYSYGNVLSYFKLHTLGVRRCCLDVLFFKECFQCFKILSHPFGNCWFTRAKSKFWRI